MIKNSPARAPLYLLACIICLTAVSAVGLQSPKVLRVTEISLRRLARKVVMPEFPKEARKRSVKGVTVAELEVDEQGGVASVEILEAPHASVKMAVADAVRQWKFKPSTLGGEPIRLRGKLTFYYVNEGRKGRVENPKLPY